MAANRQSGRVQQLANREHRIFSASDDSAMIRQIQATHSPDGREVDVKPILHVIEELFLRAIPSIDGIINGMQNEHVGAQDKKTTLEVLDDIPDALAYIMHKISCELSCKCSGGGDAHTTTMAILNMLSSYPWDAKVVISLAAFAVSYGEFWLIAQLYTTHPLAKSIALLKQLPDIIEHSASLKSRFDAINSLLKAILDVIKCIVGFKELPSQYISPETPPLSAVVALVPSAAYWTIRSMVASASQITSLLGMSYEHITSTTEAWELSSLAHNVGNIYGNLNTQLALCYQHIDEKKHVEYYNMLMKLFETTHSDNIRILKALIYSKDDILPLFDGSTRTRVNIEVLRRKTVLLLISDLDLPEEELLMLTHTYQESRSSQELDYQVVWLPIVDLSTPWNEGHQLKFEQLRAVMPWLSVHHPSLLEPAVTRYIKEVWHFEKKMILVTLDLQGKVACQNAMYMLWIWGNLAYPFTNVKEEVLWKQESWRLELLVDGIDANILNWIALGSYICLYGGEDIEWIRNFTKAAKAIAGTAGITLELIYIGKSSAKERVKRIISTITSEGLSHTLTDPNSIWFFWTRLESMWYSKMQHGRTIENDRIMQEVMTVLSFNGGDQSWAVVSKGLTVDIARANGDLVLKSVREFETWKAEALDKGFVPALIDHLQKLHTPQHCNRLILPGITGAIQERVVCAECGRPMEKYFMYRCCTD